MLSGNRTFARNLAEEFAWALVTIYNRRYLVINHRDAVGRQGRRSQAATSFPSQPQWLARKRQCHRSPGTGIGLARLLPLALLLFAASSPIVRSQTVTEFPIPSGYESKGIVAGPDGNIWFAEYLKIGRVTLTGVITLFATPTFSASNGGIASGSDGNLWFTEQVGIIGRITPAGAIVEFQLPVDFLAPTPGAIVAGSDGNLWFTEVAIVFNGSVYGAVGRIGRITTAGLITEFPVTPLDPTSSGVANISGIASGPDGNLWFTESGANKIGRITTAGIVTEFALPTAASQPLLITAGPDGNLWFTEANACQIGRITTVGGITEFPLSSTAGCPFSIAPHGITAGPDGNLWFTEYFNSSIARITTTGVITEFPLPGPFVGPYDITTGLDGNLWITGQNSFLGDQIVRFTPPVSPAPGFFTLIPCRLLDTRNPVGPSGGPSLAAQTGRVVSLGGACGVPSSARALVLNVTVTQPSTGPGFLTLYPGGIALPLVSTINYSAGQTRANNAILTLGPAGDFQIWCGQRSGTADVVVDVFGYFQ
jgi:virginiamycin B lyase